VKEGEEAIVKMVVEQSRLELSRSAGSKTYDGYKALIDAKHFTYFRYLVYA
jgi:hypothetical protein